MQRAVAEVAMEAMNNEMKKENDENDENNEHDENDIVILKLKQSRMVGRRIMTK